MPRPAIGLVSAYFTLFDAQMPADFRARQEAAAIRLRDALGEHFEVACSTGLLTSVEDGEAANASLRRTSLDAIVFAPTMAAPPAYAAAALADLSAPVVLWNAPATDRLDDDLDQAAAHEHTTLLGALMLANVLVRQGRRAHVVTASLGDPAAMDRLLRTVRALAAGHRVRGRTVLRIGDPFPGYLNVESSAEQLARLGVREHRVERDELERAVAEVDEAQLADLGAELDSHGWRGAPDERAARLAAAMRRLATEHQALCGTVNCHGPLVRRNPRIGVPACLGTSVCAASGVPFSCTGDQPTALALALGRALAGSALYCEIYAPELATGTLLLANGGEGDVGLAAGAVTIVPSSHYPGVHGAGSALAFAPRLGRVTLVSLTPLRESWRLVWALGELTESRYPRMQAPNAMFRFALPDDSPAAATLALDRWLASGATHHNALVPGHLDLELPLVADALGIESHRVA